MRIEISYDKFEKIHSILVIQLGDIGDVIWTAPTLFALKEAYPTARISLLMREAPKDLLEGIEFIHKTFVVRKYSGSWLRKISDQTAFIKNLRSERFDLVIDLRADDRGAFMAWLSGAPIRAALYYPDAPFWRNHIFTHLAKGEISHEILGPAEQSLRVIRPFGIGEDYKASLYPMSENIRERVRASLPRELVNQATPWFTVSPFAKWSYKEWTRDKWVQIFNWLWNEYGVAVLIVGSKDDKIVADHMIRICSGRVYNFAGRTRLSELIELIRMSHLHVSIDTGAAHIAAAVGTPTITIYGPSYFDGWAHPGKQHMVVLSDMECVPCHQTGCNGQHRSICLETLGVEKVQRAIKSMFEEHCQIISRTSS